MTRMKYGVEYDARRREDDGSSGAGWIVVLVIIVAAILFIVHVARRISSDGPAPAPPPSLDTLVVDAPPDPATPDASDGPAEAEPADGGGRPPSATAAPGGADADGDAPLVVGQLASRPPKVQNLLLRLQTAARKGDVAMQVEAIEKLRALPGDQVADIENVLADRLGRLNVHLLYERKNPQWVADVEVRKGDNATRIAHDNRTTLAAIKRLNPSVDLNLLRPGMKLKVMRRPAFGLVVHKKLQTVDLNLDGKLFRRYPLAEGAGAVEWEPGVYETPANLHEFFRERGVELTREGIDELDELVPRKTPVQVSPM